MRKLTVATLSLLLLLSAAVALAEDAPAKKAEPAAQTAVFAVPHLEDAAVVKDLAASLAKEKGVMAAKAEGGKFLVTFESAATCPTHLTAAVTKVAPEAKLETVQAADVKAAHGDCGKCPSKATCDKAKKEHAK